MLSDRNFGGSSAELCTEVFPLTVRCTPPRGKEKNSRWVQELFDSKNLESFLLAFKASAKHLDYCTFSRLFKYCWEGLPIALSEPLKGFLQILFFTIYWVLANRLSQSQTGQLNDSVTLINATLQVQMKILMAVLNTHLSAHMPYTSMSFPEKKKKCLQAWNAALHFDDLRK